MDRAEAEDTDAVVAVESALLNDRHATAHRLPDAQLEGVVDFGEAASVV